MDTRGFRIGDVCTVKIDWGSGLHRGKRAAILKFHEHGRQTFATVVWRGKKTFELREEYGVQFNVDELEKVS
jgi:hypothetical protein